MTCFTYFPTIYYVQRDIYKHKIIALSKSQITKLHRHYFDLVPSVAICRTVCGPFRPWVFWVSAGTGILSPQVWCPTIWGTDTIWGTAPVPHSFWAGYWLYPTTCGYYLCVDFWNRWVSGFPVGFKLPCKYVTQQYIGYHIVTLPHNVFQHRW